MIDDGPRHDTTREGRLLNAIGMLSDTLVADYDVVDVAQVLVDTSTAVFDVAAAGLLLEGADGTLDVLASSSEASRLIEVLQINAEAGPCMECFRSGEPVLVPDVAAGPAEWKPFIDRAEELGFRSVHAIPLRHRDTVLGTLNLLGTSRGTLNAPDLRAARTLADVTALGILQDRSTRESVLVKAQLERALTSRIAIEQAKGFLSHTNAISLDEAFGLLRTYARTNRIRLVDVAERVTNRRLTL